jgi:hypothetical protein
MEFTYPQKKQTSNLDYYGKKVSMKRACNNKGRATSNPASLLIFQLSHLLTSFGGLSPDCQLNVRSPHPQSPYQLSYQDPHLLQYRINVA